MSLEEQPLTIILDGQPISFGLAMQNPLIRAAIISVFTWRRANPDDALPGTQRMGWWGDDYPVVQGDKTGSRLWLLSRAKLVPDTYRFAKLYVEESVQWMLDDGVAARIEVVAERYGLEGLAIALSIYESDAGTPINLRFANVWEMLKHV